MLEMEFGMHVCRHYVHSKLCKDCIIKQRKNPSHITWNSKKIGRVLFQYAQQENVKDGIWDVCLSTLRS